MDPVLPIILVLVGAGLGFGLSSPDARLLGTLLGGFAAWAAVALLSMRSQLKSLSREVNSLRPAAPPTARAAVRAPTREEPSVQPPIPAPTPEGLSVQPPAPQDVAYTPQRDLPTPAESVSYRRPGDTGPKTPVLAAIREFFTGGNTVARVGVIILFFGIAFLLRYMAEHSHLPLEVRLTGVAMGALILLAFGWRLRVRRPGYALALQGGAIGILYLTVFAAMRLYGILPAAIAFPLLILIAGLSAALAVLQDSMSFAMLGVTGGFLAPILASTGEGSHVVLFSYYAVLNAGILLLAWFKAWRPLNVLGFVFTFAIGTAWGVLRYRADAFASTEPFLVLFFLFYLAIGVLFTFRQPVRLTGYIDGTLIFATPIVAFALQAALLHDRLMSLAFSAVGMSAVYLGIAWWLKRRAIPSQTLLIDAFIAIGVAFVTLAMPLALDAQWNAAAWAIEGVALIWVGCRQNQVLAQVSGCLLNGAAGLINASQFNSATGHVLLPLAAYFDVIAQSAAAILSAHLLNAHQDRLKPLLRPAVAALFWWGLGWWTLGGLAEVSQYGRSIELAADLLFFTATTLACSLLWQLTGLKAANTSALLQLPAMAALAMLAAASETHLFAAAGWLAWPVAFAAACVIARRHEGALQYPLANFYNVAIAWLFCAVSSWEAAWAIGQVTAGTVVWSDAAWALIPAVWILTLPRLVTRVQWPFARYRRGYLFVGGVGIAAYLALWSVVSNVTSDGDAGPLPYCPFFNPLDLCQAFVLMALLRYWRFLRTERSASFARIDPRIPLPVLSGLSFIWLNAVLLRTLHQWFGIGLGIEALLASTLVQTSLSILWAVLAFGTMLVATRQGRRVAWSAGAVLLAVVVAKLFLVDLSRIGSVERIVSFVGVGLLMLIVGYLSPLPPSRENA